MQPLTPINEVESDRISINIPLPTYAQPEKIGVNIELIERLAFFAGIKELKIGTFREDDKISTIVQNAGSNLATALGIKSKTAPQTRFEQIHGRKHPLKCCQYIKSDLDLNVAKLQEHVQEMKGGVHSHDNWVKVLNRFIREGINQAGTENLTRVYGPDLAFDAFWISAYVALGINLLTMGPLMKTLMMINRINISSMRGEPPARFSLIPGGCELDRAVIFKAALLNNRNNFVRTIEGEECE